MFYETKSLHSNQGDIGAAVSTDGGSTFLHLAVVLDEPWHLSYPFVFEDGGTMYMVPEGSNSGKLYLYRADVWPTQWVRHQVLVDAPLIDASLLRHDGRWYLFASNRREKVRERGGAAPRRLQKAHYRVVPVPLCVEQAEGKGGTKQVGTRRKRRRWRAGAAKAHTSHGSAQKPTTAIFICAAVLTPESPTATLEPPAATPEALLSHPAPLLSHPPPLLSHPPPLLSHPAPPRHPLRKGEVAGTHAPPVCAAPRRAQSSKNCRELEIWFSDTLTGAWTRHPGSPVKSWLQGSRMAGRPIKYDGQIYRFGQDCTFTYGHRVSASSLSLDLAECGAANGGGGGERQVSTEGER
eukprot:365377-Chlamydomonas_euryale.AAC.11